MKSKELLTQVTLLMICTLLLVGCGIVTPAALVAPWTVTPTAPVVICPPQTKFPSTSVPLTSTRAPSQTTSRIVTVTPTLAAGAGNILTRLNATAEADVATREAHRATLTLSAGGGNIRGRLMYQASGKPASGYWIGLGTANFSGLIGMASFNSKASTTSDIDGYFAFPGVAAGEWIVAVKHPLESELSPWQRVTVTAGTTVTVELKPTDRDLMLLSPPNKSVLRNPSPTFCWTAYPDASSYQIDLYLTTNEDGEHGGLDYEDVFEIRSGDKYPITTATEISPIHDLPPGWYKWSVTALRGGNTWAYCDCGGEFGANNYWTFGIVGDKTLVVYFRNSNYIAKPSLDINNNSKRELTVELIGYGKQTVGSNDSQQIRDISPGTYNYTASVSSLPQISGTITIQEKGPQQLTFFVSSSIGAESDNQTAIVGEWKVVQLCNSGNLGKCDEPPVPDVIADFFKDGTFYFRRESTSENSVSGNYTFSDDSHMKINMVGKSAPAEPQFYEVSFRDGRLLLTDQSGKMFARPPKTVVIMTRAK